MNSNGLKNGAEWEGMMQCLLQFIDSKTRVYSRPGQDWGIDALSGDGKTIYQAKYHMDSRVDNAIIDAKNELAKIKDYRESKPYWKTIRKWVLFANCEINPNDEKKWTKEIALLFHEQSLVVELWHWGVVEKLLVEYPQVRSYYFNDEARTIFSFSDEVSNQMSLVSSPETLEVGIRGRTEALNRFREFLNDGESKIWSVSGPGGMGKSRFLLECGKIALDEFSVHYSKGYSIDVSEVLKISDSESKSILFIDELDDLNNLQIIIGELNTGRIKNWKVVFTERESDSKTIKHLKNPKFNKFSYVSYRLSRLNEFESLILIKELLKKREEKDNLSFIKPVDEISYQLYKITDGIPLWIGLVLQFLKEDESFENLPIHSKDVLDGFIRVIDNSLPAKISPQQFEVLRQWCALLGRVNSESKEDLNFLSKQSNIRKNDILTLFELMCDKGIAFRKGARQRFLQIAPDSIRDQILSDALIELDELSEFGQEVVQMILKDEIPSRERVITELARIEYLHKGGEKEVNILEAFINDILYKAECSSTTIQLAIVRLIDNFEFAIPSKAIGVLDILLSNDLGEDVIESNWGNQKISHKNVMKELPWSIFGVARYVESKDDKSRIVMLFERLCQIEIETNQSISKMSESSKELFTRTLFGEHWSENYEELVELEVSSMKKKVFEEGTLSKLEEWKFINFLSNLSSAERRVNGRSYGNTLSIGMRKYQIGGEGWANIQKAVKILKSVILAPNIPNVLRTEISKVYSDHLTSVNRSGSLGIGKDNEQYFINEFSWLKDEVLSNEHLINQEVRNELRSSWSWHLDYSEFENVQERAKECEELLFSNPDEKLIDGLISERIYSDDLEVKQNELIKYFFIKNTFEELQYIISIYSKIKMRNDYFRFQGLLDMWVSDLSVTELRMIYESMKIKWFEQNGISYKEFIAPIISQIYFKYRLTNVSKANDLLEEALDGIEQKKDLLSMCFIHSWKYETNPTNREVEIIERYSEVFNDDSRILRIWSSFLVLNWAKFVSVIDGKWIGFSEDDKIEFVCILIEDLYFINSRIGKRGSEVAVNQIKWLLNKASILKSLDKFEGQDYHLKDMLKGKKLFDVSWLRRVLDKRSELFGDDNCISDRLHFSSWVDVDWDSIFEKEILKEIIHDYLFRDGVVGYFFPSFIKAIDKSGDNISKVLSELIQKFNVSNDDEKFKLQRLARVAGEYRRNSNGWMIISAAICEKLSGEDIELQKEFFLSLDWNGIGSISGVRGTVPVYYTDQLKELEGLYIDDQKKGVLVREEYWKQEIEWARNELKQAEEKAREERGE